MSWLQFIDQACGRLGPAHRSAFISTSGAVLWGGDDLCEIASQQGWPEGDGLRWAGADLPPVAKVDAVLTDCAERAARARRRWPAAQIRVLVRELTCNRTAVALAAGGAGSGIVRRRWRALAASEYRGLAAASEILAASPAHRDELLEIWPMLRERVRVTPFTPNRAKSAALLDAQVGNELRKSLELRATDLLVTSLQAVEPGAGVEHVIRAAAAAGPRVHLLLAPGAERRTLSCLAERLRIADRVHWTSADVGTRIAAADAAVSAALYDMRAAELSLASALDCPVLAPRHAPPSVYCGWPALGVSGPRDALYDRSCPAALAVLLRDMAERDLARSRARTLRLRPGAPSRPRPLRLISAVPA